MRRLLLLILLCFHYSGYSQSLNFLKQYGYSGPATAGRDMVVMTDGGIALVATVSLPNGSGYYDNIMVLRMDSNGDTIWTRIFGSILANERAESMTRLANGNMVIAGNMFVVNKMSEAVLICIDSNGNLVWRNNYGGPLLDYANAVKEVANGIVVAGATTSFGSGGFDAWLFKVDYNGDSLWSQTYGGTSYDDSWDVADAPGGGFMLTGGTYSYAAGQYDDAWLIRTAADGSLLWRKTYGLSSRVDWAWSLEPVISNGVISGHVFVGVKNTAEDMPGAAYGELHFVKVDTAGTIVWDKSISGPAGPYRTEGMDIAVLNDGGYMIAGWQASNSGKLLYLVRADAQGNVVWDTTIGQNSVYTPWVVKASGSGVCFVSGSVATQPNSQDIFVAKLGGLPTNIPAISSAAVEVSVYPNPALASFTIECTSDMTVKGIEVYDISGRLLKKISGEKRSSLTLETEDLNRSLLLLKIMTSEGPIIRKLEHR